jgi:AmpE protein
MIFFSILIVLAFIQLQGSGKSLQRDDWLKEWAKFLSEKIPHEPPRLAVIIIVPVLIVALLDTVFADVMFGLLSLILYVAMLIYSLGRGEFNESIDNYLMSWRAGNFESAYEKAERIGDFQQTDSISDSQGLHDRVRAAILYEGYQRWFAVVFWFLILGPAGALAYRICYLTARLDVYPQQAGSASLDDTIQQQAHQWVHYLDWLPARFLAAAFCLTGKFESAVDCCISQLTDNKPAAEFIDDCAVAALHDDVRVRLSSEEDLAIEQGERDILAVQSLLSRSVICWLVAIALLQLIL